MDIIDILSLKRDRDTLKDCVKRFREYLSKEPTCDKHDLGFNRDNRFRALKTHNVSLDSWKGFYGDSSSCTYLSNICNEDKFWRYFDNYLNEHKEEILNYISNKFNDAIKTNINVIEEKVKNLNKLIEEVNN